MKIYEYENEKKTIKNCPDSKDYNEHVLQFKEFKIYMMLKRMFAYRSL
jgi:hypothetical protein